jgi:hypothetical protein
MSTFMTAISPSSVAAMVPNVSKGHLFLEAHPSLGMKVLGGEPSSPSVRLGHPPLKDDGDSPQQCDDD